MTSAVSAGSPAPAFVTTRWTEILNARGDSPEARVALGQLCQAYWLPVFRFIARNHFNQDTARDLTQEFFAQLLSKGGLDNLERGRGRFRSYLLGAVRHFLADQRDRAGAAKRGGGQVALPVESQESSHTTVCLQVADPSTPVSDAFFDREWALNVVERALTALADEFAAGGKTKQFEILKPWLVGELNLPTQLDAAQQLGMSEGAVKVTIHRLRKRFRELVKAEIAGTVDRPETVQGELQYLVEVLAAG